MDERVTRLREVTTRLAATQAEIVDLSRLRRQLVQDLHAEGWSYARIAEAAGLGRTRIHQIRHSGPAVEGAFFGANVVTIATPLKMEAANARAVVAAEDFSAAQALADQVRDLQLEVGFEHVPLGGAIDLNRAGLVVICGPRLSPVVAKVLATDPALAFERAGDGPWTLMDRTTTTIYRSGPDSDPPGAFDIAYLGKLRRPDGQGELVVFTGIHPQGSLGVVQYLGSELPVIYEKVGDRRFSMLLRVAYDAETNAPTNVVPLTAIHIHEEA